MSRNVATTLCLLAALALAPASAAQTATLTIHFTNRGEPLENPDNAKFYVFEYEKRENYLGWGHDSKSVRVPEGIYDVVVRYRNDQIVEEQLFEELELSGEVEHEIDFDIEIARLTVQINSGGQPIPTHAGRFSIYPAGNRGKPLVSRRPGETVTIRPGSYDIEVAYRDHRGLQASWLEYYYLEGERFEQVDFGPPAALFTLTLLERGRPLAAGRGRWRVFEAGKRDEPVARGESGDSVELPAGLYDVEMIFRQGHGHAERWLEGIPLRGEVRREIELAATLAPVRVDILQRGRSLSDGWFTIHPVGDERTVVASAMSGTTVEIEPGFYDIGCFYRKRGVRVESWLRSQSIVGRFDREVELDFRSATVRIEPARRSRAPSNVLLLVDSSTAMGDELGGRSKLELAGLGVKSAAGALRGGAVKLALRAYGVTPASRRDCRDTALLLPPDRVDPSRLATTWDLLRPEGLASIAYSLDLAATDLPAGERNHIVLIAGGVDGCGRDPCESATRLLRGGSVERVYVVGLGIPRDRRRELSCAGEFYPVSGRSQLRATLLQIFREIGGDDRGTVSLFLPAGGAWIASGTLGETLDVAAGRYDLVIHAAGRTYHWTDVEISGRFESRPAKSPDR